MKHEPKVYDTGTKLGRDRLRNLLFVYYVQGFHEAFREMEVPVSYSMTRRCTQLAWQAVNDEYPTEEP